MKNLSIDEQLELCPYLTWNREEAINFLEEHTDIYELKRLVKCVISGNRKAEELLNDFFPKQHWDPEFLEILIIGLTYEHHTGRALEEYAKRYRLGDSVLIKIHSLCIRGVESAIRVIKAMKIDDFE